MTDIAAWLRGLGLGRYEAAFRDNDVGADVLPELTADDLREMGVASVGHRRKLLAAIAALRGPAAVSPPRTPAEPPPAATPPGDAGAGRRPEGRGAERRHLTVLFCDLAGSTRALRAPRPGGPARGHRRLPPRRGRGGCGSQGGYVAKFLGDGVLAYFGWPQAHEDDAECAVGAGLAATEAVAGLERPPPGRCRRGSGSPPGPWWWATSWAGARRASVASRARRRTSRPGCRAWPSPGRWCWTGRRGG